MLSDKRKSDQKLVEMSSVVEYSLILKKNYTNEAQDRYINMKNNKPWLRCSFSF